MTVELSDPTAAIVKVLRDTYVGSSEIKTVYDSDPDLIATDEMPCITVEKQSDSSTYGSTGYIDVTEQIMIKVIINKADDWEETTDHEQHAMKRLRALVERRDPSDPRAYAQGTIRHTLTNRLEAAGVAISAAVRTEYGVDPSRGEEFLTAEAHLTVEVSYSMKSPTRSIQPIGY